MDDYLKADSNADTLEEIFEAVIFFPCWKLQIAAEKNTEEILIII